MVKTVNSAQLKVAAIFYLKMAHLVNEETPSLEAASQDMLQIVIVRSLHRPLYFQPGYGRTTSTI